MNCKPGDLAVIVKPDTTNRNLGRFVEVLRATDWSVNFWWVRSLGGVHSALTGEIVHEGAIEDARLRPIRPNDGEDETLTWAGKPEHVKEEA